MSHAMDRVIATLRRQRVACRSAPYPSETRRRADLRALRRVLRNYRVALAAAMEADFGRALEVERSVVGALAPALQIAHALDHLGRWMRPGRRRAGHWCDGNTARVVYQPKGVVGVIAAGSWPVVEALGALVAALAAGNRVMILMGAQAPHSAEVLRGMLAAVFRDEQVAVFGGADDFALGFAGLPLDHMVFSGAPEVGRDVMRAASANLTPVTLTLGGKCPAIVGRSADIAAAARSVAHGKAFCAGQTGVAPDYALVPVTAVAAFVDALARAFRGMYCDPAGATPYPAMATADQAARVHALLADAVALGATVVSCGAGDGGRVVPLQIVTGVTPAMRIMREELLAPILPVLGCDTLDQALQYVGGRPRPPALYYYGSDRAEHARVTTEAHAGGITINDWGCHLVQCELPFNGCGGSGIGGWRGPEGFYALSHAKVVFTVGRWFPAGWLRPPYGKFLQWLALWLFLPRRRVPWRRQ